MAANYHLKLDKTPGESLADGKDDCIDILNFDWRAVNPTRPEISPGSGIGRVKSQPMEFVHLYDKASPMLAKHCVAGTHLDSAVLTASKSGDGAKDYLKITMKQAVVESVNVHATPDGDIAETFTISFLEMEIGYTGQKADGSKAAEVKTSLHLGKNTAK